MFVGVIGNDVEVLKDGKYEKLEFFKVLIKENHEKFASKARKIKNLENYQIILDIIYELPQIPIIFTVLVTRPINSNFHAFML